MSTTEQRFEVPPEYAEVYERAYRRAYEEGQNQLSGRRLEVTPRRLTGRGKRIAIPQQRTGSRRTRTEVRPGGSHSAREAAHVDPVVAEPVVDRPRGRTGHRADARRGSTLLPLAGLGVLLTVLLIGAFLLGRVTADTVSVDARPVLGTGPGAVASATEGPAVATTPAGAAAPYSGAQVPLTVTGASSTCAAPPVVGGAAASTSYDVDQALDDDPGTAWGCAGQSLGTELVLTLPAGTQVVSVGLVPGFATSDPATGIDRYAQDNRVTQVAWVFGDGSQVVQSITDDPLDRSLRTVPLPVTTTDSVTLRILGVAAGEVDATLISTVVLQGPTG